MMHSISLHNFKSIRDLQLKLGAFNIFIGTNASGKSNIFDAFRFLQGVGWGLSIEEILNGRPRSGAGSEWEGIRGGAGHLSWAEKSGPSKFINSVIVGCVVQTQKYTHSYGVSVNVKRGCVRGEFLVDNYATGDLHNEIESPFLTARIEKREGRGRKPHVDFEKHRPILQQIGSRSKILEAVRDESKDLLEALRDVQHLDPVPAILRQYSTAMEVQRMGERGENFAALISQVIRDPKKKEGFLSWLHELRPNELDNVKVLQGAMKEPLFALVEGGRVFPAPVLSDGTLRFAALTAAFFQPSMPKVLLLEEIENGVNAGRMKVLLELLKSRAGAESTQVLATSHSAMILDWLSEDDYKHVFLCKRCSKTGETLVSPLTEVPNFLEAVKSTAPSQLVAEGWMEHAL